MGTARRVVQDHHVDKFRLRLIFFSKASFGNNKNLAFELGHITILTDDSGRGNVLVYATYK